MKDLKQLKEQWAKQNFDKQYSKEELNNFSPTKINLFDKMDFLFQYC